MNSVIKDYAARLVELIQKELLERKGVSSMIFQNHLYGCFILMEDIAQGVLEWSNGYITGNSFYLQVESQFGHIGFRYYGFLMDGKAVLDDISAEYKQAWIDIFRCCKGLNDMVDKIEEEVIQRLEEMKDDRYFMNAMEHDGNLTPDWMEKAIYGLHPQLRGEEAPVKQKKKKARCLAVTRRQHRTSEKTRWSITRRQNGGAKKGV